MHGTPPICWGLTVMRATELLSLTRTHPESFGNVMVISPGHRRHSDTDEQRVVDIRNARHDDVLIRSDPSQHGAQFCERTSVSDDLAIVSDRNTTAAKRFECWVHGVRVMAGQRAAPSVSPLNGTADGSFCWCCQVRDGGGGIRFTGLG